MFLQTNLIYKCGVGIYDVLRFLVAERPDQNGDDALGNDGITISGKYQFVTVQFRMHPHLALATFYEVVVRFILFVYQGKGFAQFYHVLVPLHPVIEHGKLIDYLFLYLLYRHVSVLFKSTTRQIVRQVFMIKITSWSKEHTFG